MVPWNVFGMFVRVKQIYIDPNRGSSMHSMTGRERCDFTTEVNALQPRVLVSKVRKSASDLEMLLPISTATKPELHVESPPSPGLRGKSHTKVKACLWGNKSVAQLDQISSPSLWSERVFKEHQCNKAAPFPVYINHPPPFLGWSLASGQKEKKHRARWTTKLSD